MRRPKRSSHQPPDAGAVRRRPSTDAPSAPPAGAPDAVPSDGDHNQGGARPEGLDYQRDLGLDQDA